jgi:hypothetical protein
MPLPLEKEVVVPNALIAPLIVISTNIIGGRLVSSAQIQIKGAKVDAGGIWTEADSSVETLMINDVENLPHDIASIAPKVGLLFETIVEIIGEVNAIRKVK